MVCHHGLRSILCLLLAIYEVKARFCTGSIENKCVPLESCRIDSSNRYSNWGCRTTETCCAESDIIQHRLPIMRECGHVNKKTVTFTLAGLENMAQEAEQPWVVAVLDATRLKYKASGSLIAQDLVLTANQVIADLNANELIVRAGEWDFSTNTERDQHVDVAVRNIVRHPDFSGANGANNVALLFLADSFPLTRNIGLICLPPPNRNFITRQCIVGGWDEFKEDRLSKTMKRTEVPVIDSQTCERQQLEYYPPEFSLDNSLLCVDGRNSWKGYRGVPLACPLQSDPQRYELAGILSFGFLHPGNIPPVFTDVSKIRSWIDQERSCLIPIVNYP
ncbi:phenoloxidase-activating factor 2-like [Drosophila rhopaloa]|uniref:Peptidase S1 domain-containing protein n=1 Tax=Drosophila rhopaloa TaxID=1041015 RepID=A0ABM5HF06_DRORH|nr:phenoloxidase-activating factor 2-like [Drosophila rhopaloa]